MRLFPPKWPKIFRHLGALIALTAAVLQVGCSSRLKESLPLVRAICVHASMESVEETAYLMRRVTDALREYGFALVETSCEVTVRYHRFGGFQAEQVSPGIFGLFSAGRSGYWSQEGILGAERDGLILLQDRKVNLRGYRAKQDLLDALAWEIAGLVSERFQPKR